LAAGLRSDPLGELKRLSASPDLLAAIEGVLLLREGTEGKGRRGNERANGNAEFPIVPVFF